ncbi:Up-regulated in Daf-2 domain-containing protein [Caenorhabditis elegans]|uniref:Up-regulated in Daf-2 domain-containing protein n=1 Tax=Caenorhabditis elegans TaxID=6239 RepID=M1ZJ62_CAEEL|nr:Up-regulated in Daf-2 domain-containing protein [Caenorhabditis elegans]CCU83358.1 Up-regulated in Daf-2 domain-containing protein [Caenorhabditis elegans]|eukprot:NP_001294745.1 Protein Up-regulated in Daf-2(gf) [Caenorhabditis elegans]
MATPSAQPPQLTRRSAKIVLENKTGEVFRMQVLHEYTGEQTDDSGWFNFAPDESRVMFEHVYYNTGFFTTGVDNWKVHGSKLVEYAGKDGKGIHMIGKVWIDGIPYKSWHGLLAKWKKHTLRAEDDGQVTTIRVYPSEVQFISQSGRSVTPWYRIGEDVGKI